MTKSYDEIIGSLVTNLQDLKDFVKEYEPNKVGEVDSIFLDLWELNEYMAYGEEK